MWPPRQCPPAPRKRTRGRSARRTRWRWRRRRGERRLLRPQQRLIRPRLPVVLSVDATLTIAVQLRQVEVGEEDLLIRAAEREHLTVEVDDHAVALHLRPAPVGHRDEALVLVGPHPELIAVDGEVARAARRLG